MSKLKQTLFGAPKRVLNHTCIKPKMRQPRFDNQLSNLTAIFSKSRVQYGYRQSTSCYPIATAIQAKPKRQEQQWNLNAFSCKDIPIIEKLNQTQWKPPPTSNTSSPNRRQGSKRLFKFMIKIDDHFHFDELKPALKRQRIVPNIPNKYHNGSITRALVSPTTTPQPPINIVNLQSVNPYKHGLTAQRRGLDKRPRQSNKRTRDSCAYNTLIDNARYDAQIDEPRLCHSSKCFTTATPQNKSKRPFTSCTSMHNQSRNTHHATTQATSKQRIVNGLLFNRNRKCTAITSCNTFNNQENRTSSKPKNILFISNILSDVMSCLGFHEIFKLRGLSKFHEKEFYFKFKINKKYKDDNFDIYFECNNGYVLNILKTQISNNILNIAMYGLQCINYKMKKWFIKNVQKTDNDCTTVDIPQRLNVLSFEIHSEFEIDDNSNYNESDYIFEWSKNTQTIVDVERKVTTIHPSYLYTSSICNNVINPLFKYHGCQKKLLHNLNNNNHQNKNKFSNCCGNGNSCNKSDCNSHFCSPGTGFIYSIDINPFRELYSQIKQLEKQVSCLSFDVNHMTEYMIIGNIYHIYPLCNTSNYLIHSNDCFRDTIMNKKAECFEIDKNNNKKWYKHGNNLMYLWNNMGLMRNCFSGCDRWPFAMKGRSSLLSDLAVKGDFSQYNKFVEKERHVGKIEYPSIKDGIDLLETLFVKLDFLDNLLYTPAAIFFTQHMLLCLLKPKLLLEHKQNLLNAMMPLSETEEYEFALYDNPRYFPKNRIAFLWKLLFSTKFSRNHNRLALFYECDDDIYIELREYITKLYNSFTEFKKEWYLDKYDTLKNNEIEQKQLYQDFRIVIQALFGWSEWYNRWDGSQKQSGYYTIADDIHKYRNECNNNDKHNAQCNKDFEIVESFAAKNIKDRFINIMPQTEKQLKNLWNVMIEDADQDDILYFLEYPRFDQSFQMHRQPSDKNGLRFDTVNDVSEFVEKIWDIGQRLDCFACLA